MHIEEERMNERNARVQARYDELMGEGKHGHYETMFKVVREEVEKALAYQKWREDSQRAEWALNRAQGAGG